MKKITIILFFFLFNSIFSQKFDLSLVEKLLKPSSFVSIDELMTDGYGFLINQEESNLRKRTYSRTYNNDFGNALIITVISNKNIDKPNSLQIAVAKNYNIRDIKDELLTRGYEYYGSNDYGFSQFKKGKLYFLISKTQNEVGATQIMMLTKE